jgi:hypothetical protein
MSRFPASMVGVFFLPHPSSSIGWRREKLKETAIDVEMQCGAFHEVVSWPLSVFSAFIPPVSSMIGCIVIVTQRSCDVSGVISTLDFTASK